MKRIMKTKILLFIFSAFLFVGCQDFVADTFFNASNDFIVSVYVPDPVVAKTKSSIEGELTSLYVMVFDKNGLYCSKHVGTLLSSGTYANYKFTDLPANKGDLIILHFVGNYEWSQFSDSENLGKSEAEVMTKLSVQGSTVAYWQRYELPDGLSSTQGSSLTLSEPISLLRNMVKITVQNLTNEPIKDKYLTNVQFAVGNYMDKGTVAPYSASEYSFKKGAITEAIDGTLVSIVGDDDFVNAQNDNDGISSVAKYIYERKNSTARKQTYIIVKGCFQNKPSADNSTPSYYKIDIDNESGTSLLDLERNYHYIIRINDVALAGYPTLQEAMDAPASNNMNAAIEVSEYTSISDGTNILKIEKSTFGFVKSRFDFQIKYSYETGGVLNNNKVTVRLDDPTGKVIDLGSFHYSDGIIYGRTAQIPTNNDIYQATFTLSDGVYLSRKITIRLRKPMDFMNVMTTPNNGTDLTTATVANQISQPVTISFSFPPDISPSVFPLPIYIYSKKLSPDPTKEGVQPLSTDPLVSGTYRYVYMAPYKGNDSNGVPIPNTVYFVTSTPSANEEIMISSEYFNDANVKLQSNSIPTLSNISFSPNPTLRLINEDVSLSFNIPESADKTLPYRIRIHTDKLGYVSTPTGSSCVWNDILGLYEYTTNQIGIQTINFKTTQIFNDEFVRIDGDRFGSITGRRTTLPGLFQSVRVKSSGDKAQNTVNVSFTLNSAGNLYATEGAYAYFTSKLLIPNSGSSLESTGNPDEYRMPLTSSGVQTANFVLNQDMPQGTKEYIKISSEKFNDYYASLNDISTYIFGSDVEGYSNRPVLFSNSAYKAVSLIERTPGQETELHFSIPPGSASEEDPLWVYLSSTNDIILTNSKRIGITETVPMSLYISGSHFWFKITSPGNKMVTIETNRSNETAKLTMMSVAKSGDTVSDDRLLTATNIQDK